MRLINKNIYYAIRSLLYISQRPKETISANEVVSKLKMHRAFLRRVLQILSKHKILKSLKGKGGGFIINKKPSEIKVIDVIKVFRGRLSLVDCLLEKNICPYPRDCTLMAGMRDIESKLYKILDKTTIASLLKKKIR